MTLHPAHYLLRLDYLRFTEDICFAQTRPSAEDTSGARRQIRTHLHKHDITLREVFMRVAKDRWHPIQYQYPQCLHPIQAEQTRYRRLTRMASRLRRYPKNLDRSRHKWIGLLGVQRADFLFFHLVVGLATPTEVLQPHPDPYCSVQGSFLLHSHPLRLATPYSAIIRIH